jgi:N-ethylmaleimide reductase
MAPTRLLSAYQLGDLSLPNRVVMAPLTRNRAGTDGVPTELVARYYAQRATAGLIVSEATQVVPEGAGEPGTPGIHTDDQARGWGSVTRAVHANGGRIFLQLWHAGAQTPVELLPPDVLPVAPSELEAPVANRGPFRSARGLSESGIQDLVRAYADAAERARSAGFDGIEIHAANGYLLEQFLRDETNRRTDRYGGSPTNKIRVIVEIVEAVTNTWDPTRVGVRISPPGPWDRRWDRDPATLFRMLARELGHRGAGYLHVVRRRVRWPFSRALDPYFFRRNFSGPLIVCRGFTAGRAEAVLQRGDADLVAFGRLFVSNPDLPRRIALGAPLQRWDEATFHTSGARGYVDYRALSERPARATKATATAPDESGWERP